MFVCVSYYIIIVFNCFVGGMLSFQIEDFFKIYFLYFIKLKVVVHLLGITVFYHLFKGKALHIFNEIYLPISVQ